jgi:hypothetical protein
VVISGVFQGSRPGSIPQSGVKSLLLSKKKKKKEHSNKLIHLLGNYGGVAVSQAPTPILVVSRHGMLYAVQNPTAAWALEG